MGERPAQDFPALALGEHSRLERPEQLKARSCRDNSDQVERAVKSELEARRRGSLV